jgi:hypothetical protein
MRHETRELSGVETYTDQRALPRRLRPAGLRQSVAELHTRFAAGPTSWHCNHCNHCRHRRSQQTSRGVDQCCCSVPLRGSSAPLRRSRSNTNDSCFTGERSGSATTRSLFLRAADSAYTVHGAGSRKRDIVLRRRPTPLLLLNNICLHPRALYAL